MGSTITEKILARVSGLPTRRAGDEVMAKPDFVLAYDFPGYTDVYLPADEGRLRHRAVRRARALRHLHRPHGARRHARRRRNCTSGTRDLVRRATTSRSTSARASATRSSPRSATPSRAPSSSISTAMSASSAPSARSPWAPAEPARGLRARAHLDARCRRPRASTCAARCSKGVMARDVFHHLVRVLGPASCRFQVLEIGGPAVADSLDRGPADHHGPRHVHRRRDRHRQPGRQAPGLRAAPGRASSSSRSAATRTPSIRPSTTIDLSTLEPLIVIPPTPGQHPQPVGLSRPGGADRLSRLLRVRPARGPARSPPRCCAGRQVKPRLPAQRRADQPGDHGGRRQRRPDRGLRRRPAPSSPRRRCDYCFGRIATMAPGQRAVSTGTLNVRGRMGSPDSEIYLCNAAAIGGLGDRRPDRRPAPLSQG